MLCIVSLIADYPFVHERTPSALSIERFDPFFLIFIQY